MASTDVKKRTLPPKVAAMQARKRQKLAGGAGAARCSVAPTKKKTRAVNPDELQWKSVEMPDRLDDFEGFYGLEEIDDVEVEKDESGKVSFKRKFEETDGEGGRDAAEDEEWGGFSDGGEEESKTESKPKGALKKTEELSEKEKRKDKEIVQDHKKDQKKAEKVNTAAKEVKSKKQSEKAKTQTSAFAGLDDQAEEDSVDVSAWHPLGLSPETHLALSRLKFSSPTTIQSASIPEILAGHDVIGKASTGSGKTLAFGIPILEHWLATSGKSGNNEDSKTDKKRPALALILSPTRELAHQLSTHLRSLFWSTGMGGPQIATLTGGLSVQKQQRQLAKAEVVVGTPGRLWEVISEGHGLLAWLKGVRFLVVDEADRLLSQGNFKEVEEILNVLEKKDAVDGEEGEEPEEPGKDRQTLVFSATFHKGLQQKLANRSKGWNSGEMMGQRESMEYLLKKLNFREERPKFVDVNPVGQMAEGLKEGLVECGGTEKDLYLYTLLLLTPTSRTLIFTNSISTTRRLARFLTTLSLPATALHSHMQQKARLQALERFAATPGAILVATDVAARGLDIKNVELVLHYHVPRTADTYVHRSGRTARAGEKGASVLLCAPEEVAGVRRLVAKVHASRSSGREAEKDADASSSSEADDDKSTKQPKKPTPAQPKHIIHTLPLDRRLTTRLKPRATLAKRITDARLAKERVGARDALFAQAAEDLGVDLDDSDFADDNAPGKQGRGAGRKRRERDLATTVGPADVAAWKAELDGLLRERVNVGVSVRYLAGGAGGVDVGRLLREKESLSGSVGRGRGSEFLGLPGEGVGLGVEGLFEGL